MKAVVHNLTIFEAVDRCVQRACGERERLVQLPINSRKQDNLRFFVHDNNPEEFRLHFSKINLKKHRKPKIKKTKKSFNVPLKSLQPIRKSISKNAVIFPNVKFGRNCLIEDFAIIGAPPKGCAPGELKTVIGDNAVIRSHTVIYAGNVIGNGFQTGNKANIRELNEIGHDVSIGTLSVVEHHVKIGDNVRIHTHVFIPEFCSIEDDSWIGPNVVMTNAKYPNRPDTKDNLKGCLIKKGAVVGANSTLLPGVTIGEKALIGAGSLVLSDVKPHQIVKGVVKHASRNKTPVASRNRLSVRK